MEQKRERSREQNKEIAARSSVLNAAVLALTALLTACGNLAQSQDASAENTQAESMQAGQGEDGQEREEQEQASSEQTESAGMEAESAAGVSEETGTVILQEEANGQEITLQSNAYDTLSVATWITKIGDMYYLSDCYHDQILCHENLTDPLTSWQVLTNDVHYAHTIAGDGELLVIDDTENNCVLTFHVSGGESGSAGMASDSDKDGEGRGTADSDSKEQDKSEPDVDSGERDAVDSAVRYRRGTTLTQVGNRPHFVQYDEARQEFLVWSSETGEMFYMSKDSSGELQVDKILQLPELNGIYVRSFTIEGDDLLFVSGPGNREILRTDLDTLEVKERYEVPAELAGMAQVLRIQDYYYLTISTDETGDQDYATIVRTQDLSQLAAGEYEDVYADFGLSGGTPYYISCMDGRYYLAHHRTAENIIGFDVIDNAICNVEVVY